ncbi:MAG TPA: RDD family protein [Mycobacteriales bacterium]|nr:RDD family protein [Mycobacteriales bacterium]
MTQPQDPNQPPPYGAPVPPPPPPPPYGAPPPQYGAPPPPYGAPPPGYGAPPPPQYGGPQYPGYGSGYGMPPGQRVNDPAPMGMRLLGRIIDWIVVGVVTAIPLAIFSIHIFTKSLNSDGTTTENFHFYGADYFKLALIGLLIGGAYEVGMIAGAGATLGKMAVGVRVADLATGQKPSFQQALIRWVIPAAGQLIFFLVQVLIFLSPFFDSTHRNRGWYDYAAKTIAVRTR